MIIVSFISFEIIIKIVVMNHEVLNVFQKSFIEISSYIASHNNLSLGSIIPNQNNQTGDQVKKLDQIANQIIIDSLMNCSLVRTIASEENKHLISTGYKKAPFLVSFDPLDGSSNIDVNITTGSIFAIFLYSLDDNNIINGHDIVMSGYCLYAETSIILFSSLNFIMFMTLSVSSLLIIILIKQIATNSSK